MQLFDIKDIYGKIHYVDLMKLEAISEETLTIQDEFKQSQKIDCLSMHFISGYVIYITEEVRQSFMSLQPVDENIQQKELVENK